eukprot:UN13775
MVANEWRKEYDPTIEDSYTCMINVNNRNEQLDILDTAGQAQFAALQDHWIREAEAFVLVYSIQSERTFRHCSELRKKILRNKDDDSEYIDMILLGNKADLPTVEHEVSYETGKRLAHSWNCPFLQTSAKTGDNVYEAFETLVRRIHETALKRDNNEINKQMNKEKTQNGSGCQCIVL